MVGNMIRVLRARMTLLAVDKAGMSTVEYAVPSIPSSMVWKSVAARAGVFTVEITLCAITWIA